MSTNFSCLDGGRPSVPSHRSLHPHDPTPHIPQRLRSLLAATVAATLIAACSATPTADLEEIKLLRSAASDEPIVYGMAPLDGAPEVIDGCIRFRAHGGESYALVFPYNYSLGEEHRNVVVRDASGDPALTVNRGTQIGGSVLYKESAEKMIPRESLARCPGPFFLVKPDRQ